jgi:Zn-finger nucleic acid-binding protein
MAKKKVTTVKEHPRKIPVSKKNPTGITIVDKHPRRLDGTYLDRKEIDKIIKNYDLKKLIYPKSDKLNMYSDSDKYDELIAIWTDYFNKKFPSDSLLDPDVVKALIGSESDFKLDPVNPAAFGIAQITKETFKALQDPKGEVKEFIFTKFTLKDLKDPNVAIPMAIRWLFRKKKLAQGKLGKEPNAEEIILEYKGLLKSTSKYKDKALKKFRGLYVLLKK